MSIPESCVIDWLDAEGTVEAHAARDLIESMQNRLNAYEKGVQADIARSMIKTSDQLNARVAELEQQLAASQAREKVTRKMFDDLLSGLREKFSLSPEGREYLKLVDESFGVSDDTALKSLLAGDK